MKTSRHLFYGGIFTFLMYILFADVGFTEALIIWFSTWFLIDIDHFFVYWARSGNWNYFHIFEWADLNDTVLKGLTPDEREEYVYPFYLFHGFEFLALLLFLSMFWFSLYWVFIGFFFHLFLDLIHLLKKGHNVLSKASIVWVLIRNRGKKRFPKIEV